MPSRPDQLLFDRLRDGLFQILRVAAQIVGGDLHYGRHHFRIGRNRQAGNGDRAQDDDHDGDHHREDWTVDKKSCHDFSSRRRGVGFADRAAVRPACPAATFNCPSTITRSPGFRPCSMIQDVADAVARS